MKTLRHLVALCAVLVVSAVPSAHAADPEFPDYIQKAQALIGQAEAKATQLKEYADDVLIGKNLLRNAEAEYKKNLSWSGKLDEKAEPTVKYYAAMAQLQASVILSRAEKAAQEKERARLETLAGQVKGRIKVFEDKTAEIRSLKAEVAKRDATIAALNADLTTKSASGSSAGQKVAQLTGEVQTLKWSLSTTEQKATELGTELEKANAEVGRLKKELAQKGAEASQGQEQLQALSRSRQFEAEVGKLGGVIKTGTDGITTIHTRSSLIKASSRSVTITPAGQKLGLALAELLRNYPEYRAVVKVHGFGQPAKSEDAAATDQMARLLREVAVGKGKLDPAAVEALGVGQSTPIYPKSNPEGNRRVEITFVKKQTK
jgi:outer membrane protein OmpA-like peptidoglycan-associated protein